MSRFGKPCCLLVGVACCLTAPSALAGAETILPTPPPTLAAVPNVVRMAARVSEISAESIDLDGRARVSETATRYAATLNANLLFAKDSAQVRTDAHVRLRDLAEVLSGRHAGTLCIVGYTDDLGSADHGLLLSRRRAEAVAHRLTPRLSSDVRVAVLGRGEADPVVANTSEASRARNRRVEVAFIAGSSRRPRCGAA